MKTTFTFRLTLLSIILILGSWRIRAQDTTALTPVPVFRKSDTTPPPVPAPTPVPEPTKPKKDGFNSHTRFGFRGGGIISKQDYEGPNLAENPESKFGLDLGLVVAIPIGGGFFMVQPELHFLQKGYQIDDADIYGDVTSTLNYLELPVLARVNFGGSVKLFAFAGPSVGYLISGTYEDDNGSLDPKDYLDDVEYSGHIGAGVGIGTFEIDIRYMAGLNDISDSDDIQDVKNSSVGIGLTLKF